MNPFAHFLPILGLLVAVPFLHAGTLTVRTEVAAGNPDILAYNIGHFVVGSNTHDWWRYAGVNGARVFLNPSEIEPTDDIPGFGDGVTDESSFLARRTALRADPLNTSYIDWPDFEDRYENNLFGTSSRGNRFRVNYAFTKLRELNVSILAQITASESNLPIADGSDWAGKWELWQHFYAQAFYLGRHFDVERYQMYNEPNHPNANGLTPANWLMRLQLASDAIQCALEDVNTLYTKSLTPLVYAPVNSGGASSYGDWGGYAVANRHTNFLGVTDPDYLVMHRYDYHQYNDTPSGFASDLNTLRSDIAADMAPETRFPMSISEFNVHTNGVFETIPETLDDPEKYTRLGAIAVDLIKNFEKELYCFKFAQTNDNASPYGVKKNGMHYVHNGAAPYDYGGATMAAEVWRLVNKGFAPGGDQLKVTRTDDANGDVTDLDVRVTYHPDTGNYHVFSANESGSAVGMTIDTSAWNLPEGTRYLLEEVSDSRAGSVRFWNTVSSDGTLFDGSDNNLVQPNDTVWLFTISGNPQQPEEVLSAIEDASVIDGTNADTNYSTATTLLARNDPDTADNRKAAFIKFQLPVIYPPDIQLAVLSLRGKSDTAASSVQAHVYGLDDDSWSADTLTWNNAPNLLKSAAAGNLINNRVIADQGETAHIQGQIVVTSTNNNTKMIDVTRFLQEQSDSRVSFLISQDPRWDVTLPSLVAGDTQVDGIEFRSSEATVTSNNHGPRILFIRRPDSDEDGISDEAETHVFFTDPGIPDSDSDGQTDGEEILAGSDPNDSSSRFEIISSTRLESGAPEIEWNTVEGRLYTVYRSTTLESDGWTPVAEVTGTGGTMTFDDPDASEFPKVFYRVKAQ